MLQVLRDNQLYAKYSKCAFYKDHIQYLGHIISSKGIDVDVEKSKTIMEWFVPKNIANVRAFMVLAGYYQRFIEVF